jgi:hypothetical protein
MRLRIKGSMPNGMTTLKVMLGTMLKARLGTTLIKAEDK